MITNSAVCSTAAATPLTVVHLFRSGSPTFTGSLPRAKTVCRELNEDAAAFVASLNLQLAGPRRVKLSDVLDLDEIEAPVVSRGSCPQVGFRGFGGGLFQKNAVAGTGTTSRSFQRLCPDAIVLSQVKSWEGSIAVAGPELDGWFTSPEYRTFRCKPEAAHPDYMRALLPTPWFIEKLQGLSRRQGARRQRKRPEQFLALEMPMPTRAQQETALKAFAKMRRAQESLPAEADLAAPLRAANERTVVATPVTRRPARPPHHSPR